MLKNKPGIQTMASICFTFHSMFLTAHLFAVVSADDVSMYLKLNSIDTSVQDVKLVAITRMIMMCVTIVVSLFLVIGIEDNSSTAMKLFVGWNIFDIVVDSMTGVFFVTLKGNIQNYHLLLSAGLCYCLLLVTKGLIGKQVYSYWRLKSTSDSANRAFTGGLGQESTKTAHQSPGASNGSIDIKDTTATTPEEGAPARRRVSMHVVGAS